MRILIADSDDCFEIDAQLWRPLLALARQFGWRPAGTVMPVFGPDPDGGAELAIIAYDRHWRGDYLTPQGQRIKSDDAMNLSGHLGLALNDIDKLLALPSPGAGPPPESYQLDGDDARRFFVAPPTLSVLRSFIAFCGEYGPGLTLASTAS